jgi:hypothetical protein
VYLERQKLREEVSKREAILRIQYEETEHWTDVLLDSGIVAQLGTNELHALWSPLQQPAERVVHKPAFANVRFIFYGVGPEAPLAFDDRAPENSETVELLQQINSAKNIHP